MSERVDKAEALFRQGYNCAQAVFAAYADLFGMDIETALKVSAGLGGGVGRMREVCGTVTGATLALGMQYGATDGGDAARKQLCYEKVRAYTEEFKKTNPSIICRELLGLSAAKESAVPAARTNEYYQKRPCAQIVRDSAEALEKILASE